MVKRGPQMRPQASRRRRSRLDGGLDTNTVSADLGGRGGDRRATPSWAVESRPIPHIGSKSSPESHQRATKLTARFSLRLFERSQSWSKGFSMLTSRPVTVGDTKMGM